MNVDKTIRLVIPQWQGGNNPAYHFGAELLAWLAPESKSPVITIPVRSPVNNDLSNEDGIVGRSQLVEQLHETEKAILMNSPDKIAVIGGDCLVDLVPFAYLAERYEEDLGILWIDAHPDVMTPEQFSHSHAHVLGALLGNGDKDLTSFVKFPVPASKVMIAGINEPNRYELDFIARSGLNTCSPEEIKSDSTKILDWIQKENIKKLVIHFDLDVLNFRNFRSVLFANPSIDEHTYDGIGKGTLEIFEVLNLIKSVEDSTSIVGLGIAEHLPWDAINIKRMLSKLPLLS